MENKAGLSSSLLLGNHLSPLKERRQIHVLRSDLAKPPNETSSINVNSNTNLFGGNPFASNN